VAEVKPQVKIRPEPPGRTANRRRLFEERTAAAKTTPDLVAALAEYIRGMFIDLPPAEALLICDRLASAADDERRRVRGG
jgi:hypothetical protein